MAGDAKERYHQSAIAKAHERTATLQADRLATQAIVAAAQTPPAPAPTTETESEQPAP